MEYSIVISQYLGINGTDFTLQGLADEGSLVVQEGEATGEWVMGANSRAARTISTQSLVRKVAIRAFHGSPLHQFLVEWYADCISNIELGISPPFYETIIKQSLSIDNLGNTRTRVYTMQMSSLDTPPEDTLVNHSGGKEMVISSVVLSGVAKISFE